MNEWMNEWTNERMSEWMNEWLNEQTKEEMNKKKKNEWTTKKWMNEQMPKPMTKTTATTTDLVGGGGGANFPTSDDLQIFFGAFYHELVCISLELKGSDDFKSGTCVLTLSPPSLNPTLAPPPLSRFHFHHFAARSWNIYVLNRIEPILCIAFSSMGNTI